MLKNLACRHDRFFEEVADLTLRELSDENSRLARENARLLKALAQQSQQVMVAHKPPPIPCVPSQLPRIRDVSEVEVINSEVMCLPDFEPEFAAKPERPSYAWPTLVHSGEPSPSPPVTRPVPGFVEEEVETQALLATSTMTTTHSMKKAKPKGGEETKLATDSALSRLNFKFKNRQKRRMRDLLKLDYCKKSIKMVPAELLYQRLKIREPCTPMGLSDVNAIIYEFHRLHAISATRRSFEEDPEEQFKGNSVISIDFDVLVDCLLMPDLLEKVGRHMHDRVQMFHKTMMTATVGEVIEEVTRGAIERENLVVELGQRWENILNAVVVFGVVLSLLCMGTSIDFYPEHWAWNLLEGVCAAIFVSEVIIKVYKWGYLFYFSGPLWRWNCCDFMISILSVIELSLSIIKYYEEKGQFKATVSTARLSLVLRGLRATRILRLLKLLHSPVLRDLANMLIGCVIGLPALMWVLLLFVIILFMSGMGLRIILGPGKDQDLIKLCGRGDDFDPKDPADPSCTLALLFGEEFFPSVKTSMFTSFRFMIGDYSSQGGIDLSVVFSHAYGDRYHVAFVSGMIAVMFGLFNIITAIFVDTVVTGLKHNDVKRKYARQYERKYVQTKLVELLGVVADCVENKRSEVGRGSSMVGNGRKSVMDVFKKPAEAYVSLENRALDELTLSEDDFMEVMDDPHVQSVLVDLDCCIPDPSAVFDTFDPDDSGEVSAVELVQAVLKLRGEPAKNDMVAAWVALRQLHEKLDSVQMMLVEARGRENGGRGSEAGEHSEYESGGRGD